MVVMVIAALALPAAAEETVVPVFAYNLGGSGDNVWSSELYLTNPGTAEVLVSLAEVLPGLVEIPEPCTPIDGPLRSVPPLSTVLWQAADLAAEIGCAEKILGALVLHSDGPLSVGSRTVNSSTLSAPTELLVGFGQEFPGLEVAELPAAGDLLLPGLVWHRNACTPPLFDSSLGIANPGQGPVRVTIDLDEQAAEGGVLVDGALVELPYTLVVEASSWQQVKLWPQQLLEDICLPATMFDLRVSIDGPAALYASVVDRTAQDPRTVYPIEVE
jgi:hypothetical protein